MNIFKKFLPSSYAEKQPFASLHDL